MNVPPVIRMGPVPIELITAKSGFVVLVKDRGWCIVKWDGRYHAWYDLDEYAPAYAKRIYPGDVLCWMPEDGS